MRGTNHNGRTNAHGKAYSVNHNDRRFESEDDKHIDWSRSGGNVYLAADADGVLRQLDGDTSLREKELAYYKRLFAEKLEAQNEKHCARRQYARVRTVEDYYTHAKTCPDETILQIGSANDGFQDMETFRACVTDYIGRHQAEFPAIKFCSVAIHADEASLHAHVRRVYTHADANGRLEAAQHKCLEDAGFQLPDPTSKRSRYNNLKIPYSDRCRELWLDVCREHDIRLEEAPAEPSHRSLSTDEYRLHATGKKIAETNALANRTVRQLDELTEQVSQKKAEVERLDAEMATRLATMEELERREHQLDAVADIIKDLPTVEAYECRVADGFLRHHVVTVVEGLSPKEVQEMVQYATVASPIAKMVGRKESLQSEIEELEQRRTSLIDGFNRVPDVNGKRMMRLPQKSDGDFVEFVKQFSLAELEEMRKQNEALAARWEKEHNLRRGELNDVYHDLEDAREALQKAQEALEVIRTEKSTLEAEKCVLEASVASDEEKKQALEADIEDLERRRKDAANSVSFLEHTGVPQMQELFDSEMEKLFDARRSLWETQEALEGVRTEKSTLEVTKRVLEASVASSKEKKQTLVADITTLSQQKTTLESNVADLEATQKAMEQAKREAAEYRKQRDEAKAVLARAKQDTALTVEEKKKLDSELQTTKQRLKERKELLASAHADWEATVKGVADDVTKILDGLVKSLIEHIETAVKSPESAANGIAKAETNAKELANGLHPTIATVAKDEVTKVVDSAEQVVVEVAPTYRSRRRR